MSIEIFSHRKIVVSSEPAEEIEGGVHGLVSRPAPAVGTLEMVSHSRMGGINPAVFLTHQPDGGRGILPIRGNDDYGGGFRTTQVLAFAFDFGDGSV